jgi:predicted metal-dependent peptidase
MNEQRRILDELSKTGIELLLREPFYAHIFAGLNKEITGAGHEVQTLAVGMGKNTFTLYVNANFWDKDLVQPEHRLGVVKHEMLHLVFRHLFIRDPALDALLLNVALDLVINQYIDRFQLPEDSIFLETFPELHLKKGETWFYYYQQLESSRKKGGDESKGKNNADALEQIQSTTNGLERHQPWREIRARSEMENAVLDNHLDSLMRTAHQRTNAAAWGQLPAGVRDQINALMPIPPAINWRLALRRFTQSARSTRLKNTMRRPSKRYGTNPGIRINRRQRILVAVDTSGSVGAPEFQLFFNEIHHLWKAGAEIDVVECDTVIHQRYKYKGVTPEIVQGRGGTDFTQPLELANRERPDAFIYLTDGFAGSILTAAYIPVFWLLSPDGIKPTHPSFGTLPGRKVIMG